MPVFTDLSPKNQGMSLGDILNVARGAQAYQQAEQMNPLLVREQTARTNVAEQKAPEEIQQARQTTEKGRLDIAGTNFKQFQNIVGGLATDERLLDAVKRNDVNAAQKVLSQGIQQMINAGFNAAEVYKGASEMMEAAKTDLKNLPTLLGTINKQAVGPESRLQLQTPQLGTFGGQPGTFTSGTSQVAPVQFPQTAPQPAPQGAPQVAPQATSTMQLPYPVRQGGMPFAAAPGEESDRAKNQQYRQGLIAGQSSFAQSKRNLDEVIKEATKLDPGSIFSAGILGTIRRNFANYAGDPTYKQLSKDLANVAISNIQSVGGSLDTVAGQQLTRMANGDETYPPEVLINIARRTYADLINANMQAQGAQNFKYGDNNLAAFRQAWNNNADSKVFEAISIYQNVKDPAEQKKLIDELLGSNQKARADFAQKYKNIKKLTETGEL
jgi:hypothetical protein